MSLTLASANAIFGQETPKRRSVLATAEVSTNPPRIKLAWAADTGARLYQVSRRTSDAEGWTPLATLPSDAAGYEDALVDIGKVYEYQIFKTNSTFAGYGYIRAGIELPVVDARGTVILIVANTFASDLAAELDRLRQDLVGDGWTVQRHDVSPSDSPAAVKSIIKSDYDADPNHVRALFLFGAVPVAYSGNIAPDGHPNHQGAWPADVYYGDMRGVWTDSSVTSTNAERSRNWNVPGDGRFDQDVAPGGIQLQIGRVDLSNLTCFSNKENSRSERDLLRQYLNKNHQFRHGELSVARRGLICDNFADKGTDPIVGSAWRNYAGFFGPEAIQEVGWSNYFPNVTTNSYLWTFASGGGQYYTCTGVGSSDDFALQEVQAVFTMWMGSYFGDWDNESNLLRAALGSGNTLTASYSGFPHWMYHPMALGETAGYCAWLTQNNQPGGPYPPFNEGVGLVHIALMGDPTLRMHSTTPPNDVQLWRTTRGYRLSWAPSSETEIRGYHVYRATSPLGPFTRISGADPITEPGFADTPPAEATTYMVRTIKLEHSSSGAYLNPSQGIFVQIASAIDSPPSGPSLSITRSQNSALEIRMLAEPEQSYSLESSGDLRRWAPFGGINGGSQPVPVSPADGDGASRRFFRAKTAP